MNEYSELDQRLKFLVEARPRTFLFVRVSTTAMCKYVTTKLQEFADFAIVELSEREDILEKIRNIPISSVLLFMNPMQTQILKRLDYLRDSLHDLDKLLVFIFFMEQYDRVVCDYPDFCAYSLPLLDYSTKFPVPFSLIFSNNLISNDKKNVSFSDIRLETRNSISSYVHYGINKLKHVKMNDIELQNLDKAVFSLLYSGDENAVYIVLQYLEVISSKELFDMVRDDLISLYDYFYRGLGVVFNIDRIYSLCIFRYAEKELTVLERNLINSTVKILIPYYSYSNNAGDLNKALQLSVVRVDYVRNSGDDNLLAESYNDKLILEYMTEREVEQRLADIDFLKHLRLNYENTFLYYYNKSILLLLSEKYNSALEVCDEFLRTFGQFGRTGMAYYRILLMKTWIRGMYSRQLQKAIDSNIEILQNHRSVFSENHYSIAEIHLCNAYMYYELENIDRSRKCIIKAQNILKQNHSARLKRLKDTVDEFAIKLEFKGLS